jgi:hypothetical protein
MECEIGVEVEDYGGDVWRCGEEDFVVGEGVEVRVWRGIGLNFLVFGVVF